MSWNSSEPLKSEKIWFKTMSAQVWRVLCWPAHNLPVFCLLNHSYSCIMWLHLILLWVILHQSGCHCEQNGRASLPLKQCALPNSLCCCCDACPRCMIVTSLLSSSRYHITLNQYELISSMFQQWLSWYVVVSSCVEHDLSVLEQSSFACLCQPSAE